MIRNNMADISDDRVSKLTRTEDSFPEQIGIKMSGEILTRMPHQSLGIDA